jgi:hypothetical protein
MTRAGIAVARSLARSSILILSLFNAFMCIIVLCIERDSRGGAGEEIYWGIKE